MENPILEYSVDKNTVQEKNLDFAYGIIKKFLNGELNNVDFRSVPEIMTQAILYKDDKYEIRLHDFSILESDTYIHNHSNPFKSICLEGGYEEKLWNYKEIEEGEEKKGIIIFNEKKFIIYYEKFIEKDKNELIWKKIVGKM